MPYTVACTVAALQGFGQHSAVIGSAFIAANKSEIIGQTYVMSHSLTEAALHYSHFAVPDSTGMALERDKG